MIKTAVVPAAGYGSSMNPLTMSIPKEMLLLGHLPAIEHTVIELISSGIICILIRRDKEVIKEYFNGRKKINQKVEFSFAHREVSFGLGDAIRRAKDFIEDDPFVMAIPDQFLLSEIPTTKPLLDACNEREGLWNSLVKFPKREKFF